MKNNLILTGNFNEDVEKILIWFGRIKNKRKTRIIKYIIKFANFPIKNRLEIIQDMMKNKYIREQIERAEKNHNKAYKIKIKFYGTHDDSNFLVVSEKGFKKIKSIMLKEE